MARVSAADLSDGVRGLAKGFARSMARALMREAKPEIDEVADALRDGDVAAARSVALDVHLERGLSKRERSTRNFIRASASMGASTVIDASLVSWEQGADYPEEVDRHAVRLQLNMIERLLRQSVRGRMIRRIDAAARFTKAEAIDPAKLATDINRYLRGEITRVVEVAANIVGTRVSSYGMLHEARVQGLLFYRIDAVLDDRTTDICREMDQRVFQVGVAFEKTRTVLSTTDPEEQKRIAPFPELDRIRGRSSEELQAMGFDVPPFHFLCRSVVTLVDEDLTITQEPVEAPAPEPVPEEAPETAAQDRGFGAAEAAAAAAATTGGAATLASGVVDTVIAEVGRRLRDRLGQQVGTAISTETLEVLTGEILDPEDIAGTVDAVFAAAMARLPRAPVAALPSPDGPGDGPSLPVPAQPTPQLPPPPPAVTLPIPTPGPDKDPVGINPRPRGHDTDAPTPPPAATMVPEDDDDLFIEPDTPLSTVPPVKSVLTSPVKEAADSVVAKVLAQQMQGSGKSTDNLITDAMIEARLLGEGSLFKDGNDVAKLFLYIQDNVVQGKSDVPLPAKPPIPAAASPMADASAKPKAQPIPQKPELAGNADRYQDWLYVLTDEAKFNMATLKANYEIGGEAQAKNYIKHRLASLSNPPDAETADKVADAFVARITGKEVDFPIPRLTAGAVPDDDENPFGEFEVPDAPEPVETAPNAGIPATGTGDGVDWDSALDLTPAGTQELNEFFQTDMQKVVDRFEAALPQMIDMLSERDQDDAADRMAQLLEGIVVSEGVGNSARETFNTYIKPYLDDIPSELEPEFLVARRYTGTGYSLLNRMLRRGSGPSSTYGIESDLGLPIRDAAIYMDRFIDQFALQKDMILYRGIKPGILDPDSVGKVFQDYGYMSASVRYEVAEEFADGAGAAVLKLYVPAGTKGVRVEQFTVNPNELEVILPRSLQFRIVGTERRNSRTVYRAVLIGQGDKVDLSSNEAVEGYAREPILRRLLKQDRAEKFVYGEGDLVEVTF